jgi:site-specific DNA-methyltransferase (adenine-specific)/modification methylase
VGVASRVEVIGDCTLYLGDAREILPTLAKVDAVLTDPPYGIGEAAGKNASRTNAAAAKDYGDDNWDDEPISDELMALVRAAGRWNVIFGGNYYALPATSCWLVWDKLSTGDFADCELAWTNLPKAVRRLRYLWNGMIRANGEVRGDHPTQKPLGVMAWCLQQLPTGVGSVIDPFMGSGTTGVVCARAGLRFVGIERKTAYFDAACRRIADAYAQPRLFSEPAPKPVQAKLFGDAA